MSTTLVGVAILEVCAGKDLLERCHNMRVHDRAISIGLAGDARQVGDGPCLGAEIDILRGARIASTLQEGLCHARPAGHGRGVKLCHFLRSLRFHALFIEYSGKDVKGQNAPRPRFAGSQFPDKILNIFAELLISKFVRCDLQLRNEDNLVRHKLFKDRSNLLKLLDCSFA